MDPHGEQDSEMADVAPMQVEEEEAAAAAADNYVYQDDDDNYDYDETPAFVSEGDAVEVAVDDDNAPMEDDDDDDDDTQQQQQQQEEPVVDMARLTITSHTEPVYAVGCRLNVSNQTLGIMSGGGDDKAYWHDIPLSQLSSFTTNNNTSSSSPPTVSIQTTPLEGQYQYKDSISAVAGNSDFIAFDASKPPNPEWMAVGALDGSIVLYEPPPSSSSSSSNATNGTGETNNTATIKVQPLEGPTSDIEWLCWHPKGGNVVLAGSADATLWMYHTSLNRCLQVFVGHEAAVTCGSFSADGKVAVSASSDGTVRIWAPKTGKSKHVFRFGDQTGGGPPPALTCMATPGGADQQLVMVGSEDGQAHICHIANKKHVASLRHYETTAPAVSQNTLGGEEEEEDDEVVLPSGVEAVGFCKSNPNWCATGGMDGVLKIWDLSNQGQCRHACHVVPRQSHGNADQSTSSSNTDGITKLAWHPTLPLVLVSTCSGRIQLWDARNGQLLQTLTGHRDVINDMNTIFVPSPQANGAGHVLIVSASDDHTVRVFDLDMDAALAQAPQQILA